MEKENIFTVNLLTKEAPFTGDGNVGRVAFTVTGKLEKDKDPRKSSTSHRLIMDQNIWEFVPNTLANDFNG